MNNSTEAPAVAYFNYKRPDGFEVCMTLRSDSGKEALTKINAAIEAVKNEGGTPAVRNSFKGGFTKKEPEYVEGKVCPKCSNKLVKGVTKMGKSFEKCSTNKWNRDLGKAEGCDFVNWIQSTSSDEIL